MAPIGGPLGRQAQAPEISVRVQQVRAAAVCEVEPAAHGCWVSPSVGSWPKAAHAWRCAEINVHQERLAASHGYRFKAEGVRPAVVAAQRADTGIPPEREDVLAGSGWDGVHTVQLVDGRPAERHLETPGGEPVCVRAKHHDGDPCRSTWRR